MFIFFGYFVAQSRIEYNRKNEMAILRRTERSAMVRAMCGAKLMEKKRTEVLMEMLDRRKQWFRWQR